MKEIKTENYIKKQAQWGQSLPGDPGYPPGVTEDIVNERGGAFLEQKEDIVYSTMDEGKEAIEITIDGDDYNKWLEQAAIKMRDKVEAWEVLPLGKNTLKVDLRFKYDQMNKKLEESDIVRITSYDGGVDFSEISDTLQNYGPFMKQWRVSVIDIIDDITGKYPEGI